MARIPSAHERYHPAIYPLETNTSEEIARYRDAGSPTSAHFVYWDSYPAYPNYGALAAYRVKLLTPPTRDQVAGIWYLTEVEKLVWTTNPDQKMLLDNSNKFDPSIGAVNWIHANSIHFQDVSDVFLKKAVSCSNAIALSRAKIQDNIKKLKAEIRALDEAEKRYQDIWDVGALEKMFGHPLSKTRSDKYISPFTGKSQ